MAAVPQFTVADREAGISRALDHAAERLGASDLRAKFAKFTAGVALFNEHSGSSAYQLGLKTLGKPRDPNFPSVA